MSVRWIDDRVAADGKASGFGEPFPDAVGRIGVTLTAPGFSCCIAFDPRDGAFTQQRRIVLTDLPAGNMTVHVAGFVGSVPGPSQPCSVKNPSNIGGPCDPQACDLPSYDAPSVDVDLEPGRENNAGMLFETVSVPALFDAVSLCDASSDRNPIRIAVTVAVPNTLCTCGDAVSFCDDTPADVLLEATQLDTDPRPHPCDDLEPSPNAESIFVNSVCCIDRPDCTPRGDGSPCCTANGERGLAGVRFDDVVAGLQAGCVRFRITTQDFPSGRRQLDYKLLVTAAGPSPTPTVSSTPLPSVTDTATPTRTDTATPTPTVSPTDTVSPTPTDTASVQIP